MKINVNQLILCCNRWNCEKVLRSVCYLEVNEMDGIQLIVGMPASFKRSSAVELFSSWALLWCCWLVATCTATLHPFELWTRSHESRVSLWEIKGVTLLHPILELGEVLWRGFPTALWVASFLKLEDVAIFTTLLGDAIPILEVILEFCYFGGLIWTWHAILILRTSFPR